MKYKVQRPTSLWIQTTVEADSFEMALELADKNFANGDFEEIEDTFGVDYDDYWAKNEAGEIEEYH